MPGIHKNLFRRVAGNLKLTTVSVFLLVVFVFLYIYQLQPYQESRRGAEKAKEDWDHKSAVNLSKNSKHMDVYDGTVGVHYYYDPETGLRYSDLPTCKEYNNAYNDTIQNLLHIHGNPQWTMKGSFVDITDLVDYLSMNNFVKVGKTPYHVNENILIFRRGSFHFWGTLVTGSNKSMSIATKHSGLIGVNANIDPIYVHKVQKYPSIVFIRHGTTWIGAFHESGRLIMSAIREEEKVAKRDAPQR